MPQGSDRRDIAVRSRDVHQGLIDLLSKTKGCGGTLTAEKVEDIRDRFKLWTGNLGALHPAHERISLESRLADNPDIQDQICEQLNDLEEAIQDLLTLFSESGSGAQSEADVEDGQDSPESDDKHQFDVDSDTESLPREENESLILDMVSQCLKALFRIGILVRTSIPQDRFETALQHPQFAFPDQFDIDHVEASCPKLQSKDDSSLIYRLGSANAKRRQFILYGREHKAKLGAPRGFQPTADVASVGQSSKAATFIVAKDLSAFERLGLETSTGEEEDDLVSMGSASVTFDSEKRLKLPSLETLCSKGVPFECPICFMPQSMRTENSWQAHAHRDLRSYICTSGDKECESLMFGDRDSWFNHELQKHHSIYVCKMCGCQCAASEGLKQHISSQHGPFTDEEMSSVVEHGRIVPSQLKAQDCPFCDSWAFTLSERNSKCEAEGRPPTSGHPSDELVSLARFKRHVASHQEQLAMFALPDLVDNGVNADELDEHVGELDDNDRGTDDEDSEADSYTSLGSLGLKPWNSASLAVSLGQNNVQSTADDQAPREASPCPTGLTNAQTAAVAPVPVEAYQVLPLSPNTQTTPSNMGLMGRREDVYVYRNDRNGQQRIYRVVYRVLRWYCYFCGFGPMTAGVDERCTDCNSRRSKYCNVETQKEYHRV